MTQQILDRTFDVAYARWQDALLPMTFIDAPTMFWP
jgi:hypothetical protein